MRFLLLAVCLSLNAFAHGPHGFDPGDAARNLELVSAYLDSVFVQVHQDDGSETRSFTFVSPDGERFYTDKTRIVDAMMANLEAVSRRSSFHCSQAGAGCTHRHGPLIALDTEKRSQSRHWLLRRLDALGRVTVRLTGGAAELARQHGLVPMLVVAATWPVFTVATEFLESLAIGPAHVACHLSQVAYFSALGYVLLQGHMITDAVRARGDQRGLLGRLRAIFRSRSAEKKFRKAMELILLDRVPAILRAGDYRRFLAPESDAVSGLIRESRLWADLHQKEAKLGGERRTGGIGADFDRLFTEPSHRLRIALVAELKTALTVLADLVRQKMTLAYELGDLPAGTFIARKALLGEWLRSAASFERSLWLAVSDAGAGAQVRHWAERSFRQLLYSLEATASLDLPVEKAKAGIARSVLTVSEYRDRNFPPETNNCASELGEIAESA